MAKCKHRDEEFTDEQMAKWHSKGIRQTQCQVCHKWFWPHEWKPKLKCEIVTKKPKYKTIKGWANTNNGIIVAHNVPSWNKMDRVSGGKTIPCTILIEAKYLKGGK